MANHFQSAAFATDPQARRSLTAAIVQAAIQISNEDPSTALHEERAQLANLVLRMPEQTVDRFAWAVSTNPAVVDKWTAGDYDGAAGDFSFVISTVWDSLLG